jgi:hypothetical protein
VSSNAQSQSRSGFLEEESEFSNAVTGGGIGARKASSSGSSEGASAAQSGSSRAEVLNSPPIIPEEMQGSDAIEVPTQQENEADIF